MLNKDASKSPHSLHRTDIRLLDAPHIPHEETPIGGKPVRQLAHILLGHVLPLAALILQLGDIAADEGRHAALDAQIAQAEDVQALEREAFLVKSS